MGTVFGSKMSNVAGLNPIIQRAAKTKKSIIKESQSLDASFANFRKLRILIILIYDELHIIFPVPRPQRK